MKHFVYLLGLMMFMGFNEATAEHRLSALEITEYDRQPIMLILDGVQQSTFSSSLYNINDLNAGRHHVRIMQTKNVKEHYRTHRGYSRERWVSKKVSLFDGYVYLEPGFRTVAEVSHHKGLIIRFTEALPVPGYQHGRHSSYGRTSGRSRVGVKTHGNHHGSYHGRIQSSPSCKVVTTQYRLPQIACGIPHADSREFGDIKRTLIARNFDSSRKEMAMRFINDYHFTALQLRDILLLMDFESSRVEIAKYAYTRIHNPERFYVVYDAFDFDSSADEISRYTARL